MDHLEIEATKSSPAVSFRAEERLLRIAGQSYPENAIKFYEPVLAWVDHYLKDTDPSLPTAVELQLPYLNTSSSKCIMQLLDKLDAAFRSGRAVAVSWFYNEGNERELECAEDFKEDLSLPFEVIAVSGESA